MIYHDMLGVRENATASEIDCAYEKKCSALENGDVKLTQEQLIRKRQELEKAKRALHCLRPSIIKNSLIELLSFVVERKA